ncbi:two-component system sensor ATPase [Thiobacillus denitrificans ATCC 25259]|uniref:Two-component system sensor ATPase n=1 Tax=Thiobacillus denitrificans (strain ATCC 25259 / T1) TaxID=292415 RepID=Q3SM67_THIDA|nr:histidine kinase [Thiobacillus denitrificans]AAZ96183.1 two-component system sensor ATPase [Thiobacillus denitrificans ATCC 25259]
MKRRNHNNREVELPNFCRLGVSLRIALTAEAALAASVAARAADAAAFAAEFVALSAFAQPALLLALLALCGAGRGLRSQPYRRGVVMALGLGAAVPFLVALWLAPILAGSVPVSPLGVLVFALGVGGGLLGYFNLRARALSPAVTEARLQALQARIRPHFLFNSLNAVLALVRKDPRRAEHALENMADLFRALMGNARQLAPLEDEVALTRAYLELEQLRLGDRLRVVWHTGKMPADALIPPLVIQPLVENAVYHGIEPLADGGEISLNLYRSADKVHVVVRNPIASDGSHHRGNRIALANIRERLLLHFDLDAQLKLKPLGSVYQVHIVIPYTRERTQPATSRPHRRRRGAGTRAAR